MSRIPLVVVGGGEHARVVIEAARSHGNFEVVGFVDPDPCNETVRRLGVPRLGGDEVIDQYVDGAWFALGVGQVGVGSRRRTVVEACDGRSVRWASVVHARAVVSPSAIIEPGAVIMPGAIVNSGAYVGRHVVVNSGAIIEHDVVLSDFAQIAPGATIGGGTAIGEDAFVGLGATVRDHIVVGDRAVLAMGSVVVRSIPDDARVIGRRIAVAGARTVSSGPPAVGNSDFRMVLTGEPEEGSRRAS